MLSLNTRVQIVQVLFGVLLRQLMDKSKSIAIFGKDAPEFQKDKIKDIFKLEN